MTRRDDRSGGLPDDRLTADVVHWALRQAQQGRALAEHQLVEEHERRRALRSGLAAGPNGHGAGAQTAGKMGSPAGGTDGVLSRRNLLRLAGVAGGLVGVQAAVAFGAAKVASAGSADATQGIPPDVLAAGASTNVDGSDDPDAAKIDHVRLAAINGGRSLYAPFSGAAAQPMAGHEARLYPPAAQPAQPGRLREVSLTAQERVLEIARGVRFSAWTFNGAIPGPVIRVTQGDHVRITLTNETRLPHSLHLHSVHPANQDGVFQAVPPGGRGTYEFTAEPFGVYPYHCHVDPLDQHTGRGLYGVLIIDPPEPRPPANEMVMLMNGYDVNFDKNNELYSVNGMCGYYYEHPIPLRVGALNRIYLVNMTEFDALNSLHLHANMFQYYPLGTTLTPSVLTDVVHLGIADRGILEFTYKFPGQYLFHAHQTELSMKGWNGLFNVT
jgi:FtsP/CotA-like multicopper oxidase with cupredoxin domain